MCLTPDGSLKTITIPVLSNMTYGNITSVIYPPLGSTAVPPATACTMQNTGDLICYSSSNAIVYTTNTSYATCPTDFINEGGLTACYQYFNLRTNSFPNKCLDIYDNNQFVGQGVLHTI